MTGGAAREPADEAALESVDRWCGQGLVLVASVDPAHARGLLRWFGSEPRIGVRMTPGAVQRLLPLVRDLERLHLEARDSGSGATTDRERSRLAIEGRTRAARQVCALISSLIGQQREVHGVDIVVEPIRSLPDQWEALAEVLPETRVVVVFRHPQASSGDSPGESTRPGGGAKGRAPLPATSDGQMWLSQHRAARGLTELLGSDRVLLVAAEHLDDPSNLEALARFVAVPSLASAPVPAKLPVVPEGPVSSDLDPAVAAELPALGYTVLEGSQGASDRSDSPPESAVIDDEVEEIVHRPQMDMHRSHLAVLRQVTGSLRTNRELVDQLFTRQFLATFRKSYLGLSWLVIGPLLGIVQWLIIRSDGLLSTGDTGVPYPVFVLVGTTMWGLFLGLYTGTKSTLVTGAPLLLQLSLPAEALVFQQLGNQTATFAAGLAVNLVVLAVYGVVPSWWGLALPLALLPLAMLATAAGLVVAMVAVVAVDIDRLLVVFWGLMLWLTPVVYDASEASGLLREVIRWNPLTYLVTAPRSVLLEGHIGDPLAFGLASALALVAFVSAVRVFHLSQPQLIERLL